MNHIWGRKVKMEKEVELWHSPNRALADLRMKGRAFWIVTASTIGLKWLSLHTSASFVIRSEVTRKGMRYCGRGSRS